jgi:long-chain acyl-CoA synthetase
MGELANVADMVRVHGAATPDAPAYLLGDRTVTFAELDERSNRVAQGLRALGVGPGDRVAILDKNCLEYFEVLFGAAKLNVVLVAVNWRLAPPEAAFIVNDSAAKVLVVGAELVPLLDGFESDLAVADHLFVIGEHDRHPSYEAWVDAQDATDPGVVAGPDDVAFQYYSSGTTGLPKGVMLTNGACFAGLEASRDLIAFDESSVSMAVMPQFHVAGGFWGLVALYSGRPTVLQREVDPVGIVDLIARHRRRRPVEPALHRLRRLADLRGGARLVHPHLRVRLPPGVRHDRDERRLRVPAAGGPRPRGPEPAPAPSRRGRRPRHRPQGGRRRAGARAHRRRR